MLFKVTPRRKNNFIKESLDWLKAIIISIIVALFVVSNIATVTQVKEQSMEPTFSENDRVLIYRLGYNIGTPKRGDIVILNKTVTDKGFIVNMINEGKDIIDNITYRFTNVIEKNNLIKRVVALPGDTVDIRDGKVYINGQLEEGYSFSGSTYDGNNLARTSHSYPLEIPEGKVFVLGDNRENSIDSRDLGLIDFVQLKGKVSFRIWPISRFGKVK